MKLFEKIFALLGLFSIAMIYLSIPGGHVTLILSAGLLSLMYWPFGAAFFNGIRLRRMFKNGSFKGISAWRILGALYIGVSLSLMCVGIIFGVSLYVGAELMLMVGLALVSIGLVVSLIKVAQNKDIFYIRIIKRIILIGGLALFILLGPRSVIENRFDPFSLSKYIEIDCEGGVIDDIEIEYLVSEVNSSLESVDDIIGIEINSQGKLVLKCDIVFFVIDPDKAGMFINEQDGHIDIKFKRYPGERKIEMYLYQAPERIYYEMQTKVVSIPGNDREAIIKKLTSIYCLLKKE